MCICIYLYIFTYTVCYIGHTCISKINPINQIMHPVNVASLHWSCQGASTEISTTETAASCNGNAMNQRHHFQRFMATSHRKEKFRSPDWAEYFNWSPCLFPEPWSEVREHLAVSAWACTNWILDTGPLDARGSFLLKRYRWTESEDFGMFRSSGSYLEFLCHVANLNQYLSLHPFLIAHNSLHGFVQYPSGLVQAMICILLMGALFLTPAAADEQLPTFIHQSAEKSATGRRTKIYNFPWKAYERPCFLQRTHAKKPQ